MTSRDDLLRLVDTLPEGFPSIRLGLELIQTWPEHPSPQRIMTKMREFMKERRKERSLVAGTGPAMGGLGLFGLAQGNKIPGGNTFSYIDGDTYALDTKLNHEGHQTKTTERLRLDREDRKFHYTIEVTGPHGQFVRHGSPFP